MKKVVILFLFMFSLLPSLAVAEDGGFSDWSGLMVNKDGEMSPSFATCSAPILVIGDAGLLSACVAALRELKNGEGTLKPVFGLGLVGNGDFGIALFLDKKDIVLGVSLPFEALMNNVSRLMMSAK